MANQDVYLASPLFSEGEREFNSRIAAELRKQSVTVFLPQELSANHSKAPTESQIFIGDTSAILNSRLLLAVLDGETTDAGVATEIGIALSHHIPIVGLWTDIRQNRIGSGRMYRNIYVTGAIRHNGTIVNTLPQAVDACENILRTVPTKFSDEMVQVVSMFNERGESLSQLGDFFSVAYNPAFRPSDIIANLIARCATSPIHKIIDFGCGTGGLKPALLSSFPGVTYVGVDGARRDDRDGSIREALTQDDAHSADALVLSFVLHDYADKLGLIESVRESLKPGGLLVVMDLERSDLPILTTHLASKLLRFGSPASDTRISPGSLQVLSGNLGADLVRCGIETCKITFPTVEALKAYINAFAIDAGFDLGLLKHHQPGLQAAIDSALQDLSFPFSDFRSFAYGAMRLPQ